MKRTKRINTGLGMLVGIVVMLPVVAFAARDLRELVYLTIDYFNIAIYAIMALAIVLFMWNVFIYFFKSEGDKKAAGNYVMYSVIGFAVMLSFWGMVNLVVNTLQLEDSNPRGVVVPFSGDTGASGNNTFVKPGTNPPTRITNTTK